MILAALLALGLSPGTWLRTTIPEERSPELAITPIALESPRDWPAGFTIEGAWKLDSPDLMFGGYSALLHLGGGRAIAFSDRGDSLTFTLPGHGPPTHRLAEVAFDRAFKGSHTDVEAATLDRASDTFWLAYEHSHAIGRFRQDPQSRPEMNRPAPMRDWPANTGAEAMVRLANGRFLLLGESNRVGLLFASDPLERGGIVSFAVDYPADFRPTDAAQLPDGRVLILLRRVGRAWPPFRSRLAIADPALIGRERPWRVRSLLALDGPLPHENYEALAIEPDGDSLIVWIMSDDNLAVIQRTLLIKLRWDPGAS